MAILPGSDMTGQAPESFRGFEFPPGFIGHNQRPGIDVRRMMQIDNPNMVADQVEHDRGIYARPPIGPVEYSEGNIKKSNQPVGLAGYNQRVMPLPSSADDMSQQEYLQSLEQATPNQRLRLQESLLNARQYFLDTPTFPNTDYASSSHNMVDNLMLLARVKLKK